VQALQQAGQQHVVDGEGDRLGQRPVEITLNAGKPPLRAVDAALLECGLDAFSDVSEASLSAP